MWHFECYCGKHICACICAFFLCVYLSVCVDWWMYRAKKTYSQLMITYTLNINIWIVHLQGTCMSSQNYPRKPSINIQSFTKIHLWCCETNPLFTFLDSRICLTPGIQPWIHRTSCYTIFGVLQRWCWWIQQAAWSYDSLRTSCGMRKKVPIQNQCLP